MSSLVISPEAPLAVHLAAKTILYLHIGGGTLGIASGAVALLARKGERLHRAAGNVFFASMLTMTIIAAGVAPFLPDDPWTNTTAGVFTLYLVATGWATVKRPEGSIGGFERLAIVVPVGIVILAAWLALARPPAIEATGFSTVYAFAVLSLLAAIGDVKMILKSGLKAERRIARHVWRMVLGLFVAAGSLFLGQQQVFPEALRGSGLLMAPPLAVLAALAFWMLKVRLGRTFKPAPAAA